MQDLECGGYKAKVLKDVLCEIKHNHAIEIEN